MANRFEDLKIFDENSFKDIPVIDQQGYYQRLAWFLDRSAMFLRDKRNGNIVVLKNLKPVNLLVVIMDPKTGKEGLLHIDNVEPVIK